MAKGELYSCVQNYIISNLGNHFRIQALCSIFHLSTEELNQMFLENNGKNLVEFINYAKGALAKTLIAEKGYSVVATAEYLGMDCLQLQKLFKQLYGQTPHEYRIQMDNVKAQIERGSDYIPNTINSNTNIKWIFLVVDCVLDYIEEQYPNVSVKAICENFNICESELNFCFLTVCNISISKYIMSYRIKRICEQLATTDDLEEKIAMDNGVSQYYFKKFFSYNMGCLPVDYRELMKDNHRVIVINMTKRGDS